MAYRVRVVLDDIKKTEIIKPCKDYAEALDLFLFYVRCDLELSLVVHIWCCNVFCGKRCLKLYTNH